MKNITSYIGNKFRSTESIFNALLYVLLFIFLLHPYRDYDWGWHYRYGEYFFTHGTIYMNDTFSWTMPGYQWVNHEWLYDPFMYLIYKSFSFFGLIIAGTIISFTCFYLGVKRFNLSYWKKGLLMLFYANLIGGVAWQGLRSQMVGVLFLAILVYLLPEIEKGSKKVLFMLPLFFLLFANFHGYFALGILIFGIFLFITFIRELSKIHKNRKGLFIPQRLLHAAGSFFASILATFLNPYYFYVYIEAIKHSTSPLLKYITEWTPAQFNSSFFFIFLVFVAFLIIGFIRHRKYAETLPYMIMGVIFLYLTLSSRRYFMPFMVIMLPSAAMFLEEIPVKIEKYKATAFVFIICILISFEIGFFRRIPGMHILSYTMEDYCNFGPHCSEGLTKYLLKHPPQGKGFNFYDWGGYLIGRGIQTKLFIDGRMHLWEGRSDGFKPFLSYQKIYYEKDYDRFLNDHFDWLIIEPKSPIFQKLTKDKELGNWKLEYLDDNAAYVVRER